MRTINYKGFELEVEVNGDELLINNVEASITNKIALLTEALCNDYDVVKPLTTELDYKYYPLYDIRNDDWVGIDFAIDIDKWLSINPSMQQKVLIELLMLEENEIMEQIQELADS